MCRTTAIYARALHFPNSANHGVVPYVRNPPVTGGNAELWEAGCREDKLRNGVLVPAIARILAREKSARILDVGTGTAYVPRQIHPLLSHRPEWNLVDLCPDRIALASKLIPEDMIAEFTCSDIANCGLPSAWYDAILLTFTLLEVSDMKELINALSDLTADEGSLIIALPDVWKDVLGASDDHEADAKAFLSSDVELIKMDRFTQAAYPFRARRIERVIECVLDRGFRLEELRNPCLGEASVFLLTFRRMDRAAHDRHG
jgi:hypothetical protein